MPRSLRHLLALLLVALLPFAAARAQLNIEIVDSIDALLPKVDAVLLLSVDGRVLYFESEATRARYTERLGARP